MSSTKEHITRHVTHASVDILAGILIGVFYKPKSPAGYALKGALAGLIVYQLLHDSNKETTNEQPAHS